MMDDRMEKENSQLVHEVLADVSPEGSQEKKLARYAAAKSRQGQVTEYILKQTAKKIQSSPREGQRIPPGMRLISRISALFHLGRVQARFRCNVQEASTMRFVCYPASCKVHSGLF